MDEKKRVRELLTSSNFGKLTPDILDDFVDGLSFVTVHGGDLVIREGDHSDSVFILVSGRLRVWRKAADGSYLPYNEISPGESVGESGMILGLQRTANVTALRDSLLATLSRSKFEALLVKQPLAINRVFAQAIYDYLRHSVHEGVKAACKSFAIVPIDSSCDSALVARSLAQALAATGKSHHHPPPPAQQHADSVGDIRDTIAELDRLESQNRFLLFEARHDLSPWTLKSVTQSDQIIYVASSDNSDSRLTELEQKLAATPGYSFKRKHLVVVHPDNVHHSIPTALWQKDHQVERVYPVRGSNQEDFKRLARFLTDSAVGVVLGGGGARGFAHIGVLRAIEERGIPIDLLGGNSMGALIGAQYMTGIPLEEIGERTKRFALGGEFPSLPVISILSGRRMERDLKRMFGDTKIDTLWRYFFATACNLSMADTIIQDSGYLWRAVMASNSPAGLLPPVLNNGDLLVDGAILDNVPVEAMRTRLGTPLEKRRGNGTVIAVDVDVQDELKAPAGTARLSAWDAIRSSFGLASQHTPSISDILYRAGHLGSMQLRVRTSSLADHYLQPPVASFPLMGYRQAHKIIEVGYRFAQEKLQQWHSP